MRAILAKPTRAATWPASPGSWARRRVSSTDAEGLAPPAAGGVGLALEEQEAQRLALAAGTVGEPDHRWSTNSALPRPISDTPPIYGNAPPLRPDDRIPTE